jgi:hypothetical protein
MALRLSPRDPLTSVMYGIMGGVRFAQLDFEGTIEWSSKGQLDYSQNGRIGTIRVAAFALLDQEAEMLRERDDLLARLSHLTISRAISGNPGMGPAFAEGLRKAGLAE